MIGRRRVPEGIVSIEVYLAFIAACWILAWTPGPIMSLIVANTASYGLTAGLWTLSGSIVSAVVLVTATALGMTALMAFVSEWFDVLRWVGALYLVFLGVMRLRRPSGLTETAAAMVLGPRRFFLQALFVGLSNPKTLLFLGAFLPQFVDMRGDIAGQLQLLAVTFVVVVSIADLVYTLAIGHFRDRLAIANLKVIDRVAGGLLVLGGLVLAAARRP